MTRAVAILLLTLALLPRSATGQERPGAPARLEPSVTEAEAKLLREALVLAESRPEAAIAKLRAAPPMRSAAIDYALGWILAREERLPEAELAYDRAIRGLPTFARAWSGLGRVRLMAGRPGEATEAFAKVIALGRGDAEIWKLLAYGHLEAERIPAARAAYRMALSLAPDDAEVRQGLAQALLASEQYLEARPLLVALCREHPRNADYWMLLANSHLAVEDADGAHEVLETARRLGGLDRRGLVTLGDLNHNRGLYAAAVARYEEANLDDETTAERLLDCAEALVHLDRFEEAARLLARVRERGETGAARERLLAGRMEEQKGDPAAARRAYEAALAKSPLSGEALLALGRLLRDADELERARLTLTRASRLAGFEATALVELAQVALALGDHAEAIEHLEAALEIDPDSRVARYLEQVRRFAGR
jgi:tetratricopeptide (TPR) repeat protein